MKKILLLLFIILFTGCYDYKELKNIDIITGIAVDYEDDEYTVTMEILKIEANGDNTEEKPKLISSTDEIFSKAFETNYSQISKDPYFSHLELLVLSEDLCKNKGIEEIADFFLRTTRINNNFNSIVAKDSSAYDILNNKQKNATVSSTIIELLKNSNENSFLDTDNQFDFLISRVLSAGEDIYLPSISIEEENFKTSDIALFKGFNMVNFLDDKYSTKLVLVTTETFNNIYLNDGLNAIDINNSEFKIDISKDKAVINVDVTATIKSLDDEFDLKSKDTYDYFEKTFSELIQNDLIKIIEELRYYNSDILGIGNRYYKKYPKDYYENIGNEIDYEVKVKVDVTKIGALFEVVK